MRGSLEARSTSVKCPGATPLPGLHIVKVLEYVDDSKLICDIRTPEDVEESQKALDSVHNWSSANNMKWNDGKFQVLRLGTQEE